jgi:hypothetical protein
MGPGYVLKLLFSETSQKILTTQQPLKQEKKYSQTWNPLSFIEDKMCVFA